MTLYQSLGKNDTFRTCPTITICVWRTLLYFSLRVWGKYRNQSWLSHKTSLLILVRAGFNFRIYRLKGLHYFHLYTKCYLDLKNPVKMMRLRQFYKKFQILKVQISLIFLCFRPNLRFRPNLETKLPRLYLQ